MIGILGNFSKTVKPWWLPFDFVLCTVSDKGRAKVIIVRNNSVRNIYGVAVEISKGVVVRAWEPVPKIAQKFQAPPPYPSPKPGLAQGATYQCSCGATMTVPEDNVIPSGWQFWHWLDEFRACCPKHHKNVMSLGLHKDLYASE